MAIRRGKKSKLFLNAKRKKKVINAGLIKWRQERHANRLPFERSCTSDSQTLLQLGCESSIEPYLDSSSFAQQFQPSCSSTPFVRQSRRSLTFDEPVKLDKTFIDDVVFDNNDRNEAQSIEEDENDIAPLDIVGRRIVDVCHLFQEIKKINDHNNAMGCTISNMNCIKENKYGLKSVFTLQCNMCNLKCNLSTERNSKDVMDINTGSVAGAMAIGIGHSQLEELLSAMEVPSMSINTYNKYHDQVSDGWQAAALTEMETAAKEEMQHAIDEGRFTVDNIPVLTVVADGSWSKRSYRTNYNAMSGVAAIVGAHTKKVLFLGVRNKYCTICARAEATATPATEPDIIVEGFKRSVEMYNVVYGTILADGDSNVYSQILDTRPYSNWTVDKIECTNHLLRNYCTKLRDIVTDTKSGPLKIRKVLSSNILRLRSAVTKAVQHRKQESGAVGGKKILLLQQDLTNSASHVFGEHLHCKKLNYFCQGPKESEKNYVPDMKNCGIYQQIMRHISYLADNARSLILQDSNNPAEHFNSAVAKVVGGKRINFSKRRSYEARCSAAVVSHNSRQSLYTLYKSMIKHSPRKVLKSIQQRRAEKVRKAALKRKTQVKRRKLKKNSVLEQRKSKGSYGALAQKPDMPLDIFERKKKDFIKSLKRTDEEREDLEQATIMQAKCGMWKEERRKLLTASNFGAICKRRKTTSCESLVKTLLYTDIDCPAMKYGRGNEINAISWLEEHHALSVTTCGLFVDNEIPYLGATPDGLVGDDAIVEVKCPESCRNLTPEDGILKKKFNFWTVTKKGEVGCVNKNHNYFYQVQGQLHITKRNRCFFVLWTPLGARVEVIHRDDTFWKEKMVEPLKRFYIDCLLPELIDLRHTRSMTIRNPVSYVEAKKKTKLNTD